MVRALLAIIIVGGGLGLSAGEPTDVVRIVRAQATANDNAAPIGSQLGDDNALARHAAALDNESPLDDAGRADRPAATDVAPIFTPRSITPPANREADDEPFTASHCTPDRAEASFKSNDRLVMTYYYYWYDPTSLDDPALTLRPPPDQELDWNSVAWHERQLADMARAGVDVALAVYWGTGPSWSMRGLDRMIEARENLLAAGLRPPAIGLFFDTNSYATILPERPETSDLTTDEGQAMLADQIGGFFRHVPSCHRARVDGRPLVFFWRSDTEDGDHFTFDDQLLTGLNDTIWKRHHERLEFVLEQSWLQAARDNDVDLGATDFYRWGAALNGPRFYGRTVAVGPGYDDRRIEGRPGYLRDRDSGATYSRDLRAAVMSGTPWLLLETWNELWEGTAIAETEENGREYLDITARYAVLFHRLAGERARDGWTDLGSSESVYLRRLADAPIEQGMPIVEDGRAGAQPFQEDDGTGYFHFAVDRRLGIGAGRPTTIQVEYFDAGDGSFELEYDSLDPDAPQDGIYKLTEPVTFEDTRTWRTARFTLDDASFRGRQYDGVGDFRLHDHPDDDGRLHTFGRVRLTAEPGQRPVAFGPESLAVIEPTRRADVSFTWSQVDGASGYVVEVAPFDNQAPTNHGFTPADRRRCLGEIGFDTDDVTQAITEGTSCRIGLAPAPAEGLYRWRVRAIDLQGHEVGDPSDWAFFAVGNR